MTVSAHPLKKYTRSHIQRTTTCPGCGEILIRRVGFRVIKNRIEGGACPDCARKIPGVWS